MNRYIASLLFVVGLACVGCEVPQPMPVFQPQPETTAEDQEQETTRIEFAVFGKLQDKMKERKGGDEPAEECTGPNCPNTGPVDAYGRPLQPIPQPQGGFNPAYAAVGAPLGLAACLALGGLAFLVTKNIRDNG